MNSFEQMEAVIAQRRAEPQEGSYTCYLFEKGIDKILKKVGEESAETIIAAKNGHKLTGKSQLFFRVMRPFRRGITVIPPPRRRCCARPQDPA